jgi:hypothetical protein
MLQKLSVFLVDCLDFRLKSLILSFIVLLISRPQNCLFIIVRLGGRLSLLFLLHLPWKQLPHLFFFLLFSSGSPLLFSTQSKFPIHFVPSEGILFCFLFLSLCLDYITGHIVHELLGTSLPSNIFTLSILFLLIEKSHMFFLCLNIILTFTKFLFFSLLFVHIILNQHFLKVIALLVTLFSLQLSLCLHFCFKSFNKLDFLFKIVLFIKSFFSFFFHQLSIATLFLLLGFYSLKIPSFLFTHSEKFNVLLL